MPLGRKPKPNPIAAHNVFAVHKIQLPGRFLHHNTCDRQVYFTFGLTRGPDVPRLHAADKASKQKDKANQLKEEEEVKQEEEEVKIDLDQ